MWQWGCNLLSPAASQQHSCLCSSNCKDLNLLWLQEQKGGELKIPPTATQQKLQQDSFTWHKQPAETLLLLWIQFLLSLTLLPPLLTLTLSSSCSSCSSSSSLLPCAFDPTGTWSLYIPVIPAAANNRPSVIYWCSSQLRSVQSAAGRRRAHTLGYMEASRGTNLCWIERRILVHINANCVVWDETLIWWVAFNVFVCVCVFFSLPLCGSGRTAFGTDLSHGAVLTMWVSEFTCF